MPWNKTYFLPEEVSIHNTSQDCWLIIFGVVKNVTLLVEEFRGMNSINPIVEEAGRDVSHWFELNERGVPILRTQLHPETGARVSALPYRIPHEFNFEPDADWTPAISTTLWWQNEKYNVGIETTKAINVRVMNPLIKRIATIKVCLEDTVRRIMERYEGYNREISSYTVKYLGKPLYKDLNLTQNGVTLKFDDSIEDFVPTLMVYFQKRLAPVGDLPP